MTRANAKSAAFRLLALEDRLTPAYPIPANAALIAPDNGGIPIVKIINPTTGEDIAEIQAYEDAFRGGVHAALGDVTGDGIKDVVIGPGQGGGPRIRIIDGRDGRTLSDDFVYEPTFMGGVYVSLGDVNGDGKDDIVTGTGNGGGPRVRVLDGATLGRTVLKDYFAYENSFRGGVQVAAGDVTGDGKDDVVTGTGVGGGPRVQVFDAVNDKAVRNFFAYDESFRNGVQVGTGDLDGDGRDDVLVGSGPGGGPHVRALSGSSGVEMYSFFADDSAFRGGVRVDSSDANGDGRDDLVCRVRVGNDDILRTFDGRSGRFVSAASRVVDDNPSPSDLFERPAPSVILPSPGVPGYVEGVITNVNATAGTVAIQLPNGQTVTAQAGPGTKIERNGVHTTLAAFVTGEKGEALIGPDGIAWEIEAKTRLSGGNSSGSSGGTRPAENSKVEGTITAVNVSSGVVTIRTRGGSTFVIPTGLLTKVERNDLHTTLASFKVGDFGEAKIGADGVAWKIEAVGV